MPQDTQETDWIEWQGGECPVDPETLVEIKGGDGAVDKNIAQHWCWDWLDTWPESNIVAYPVVSQ